MTTGGDMGDGGMGGGSMPDGGDSMPNEGGDMGSDTPADSENTGM